MRITIAPDGSVIIETNAVAEVHKNHSKPAKSHKKALKELETGESLSPQLLEAWNWLVAHDTAAGQRSQAMAAGLHINNHTAVYRLSQLKKKELIRRVGPGRYRAGSS